MNIYNKLEILCLKQVGGGGNQPDCCKNSNSLIKERHQQTEGWPWGEVVLDKVMWDEVVKDKVVWRYWLAHFELQSSFRKIKTRYMQYKVLKFGSQLVWKVPLKKNSFAGQNSFLDSSLSCFRKLFSLPSQEQSLQCVIFHHFKFFLFLFFWQSGNTPIFLSGARNSKIISPIFLENGALTIVGFVGFQTLQ